MHKNRIRLQMKQSCAELCEREIYTVLCYLLQKLEMSNTWGKERNAFIKEEDKCYFGELSAGYVMEKSFDSNI